MAVTCYLCPKLCVIQKNETGECRIRANVDHELVALTYGRPCSVHIDPIEKKPLFHVAPGSPILSIATVGCNLHCKNCQNWEISQENPENMQAYTLMPETLPDLLRQHQCRYVAYTYSEPLVFYEYTLDCARQVKSVNGKNALVTAAYLNQEPLRQLYPYIDAANIDIKSMSEDFYKTVCEAELKPVLDAIVLAKKMNVWVEITNLIIPTLNDSDKEIQTLCRWIKNNMGLETPLHFSQFYPQYQMRHLPLTPQETLKRAYDIAVSEGLKYIYIGNVVSDIGQDTICPKCKKILIKRVGYRIIENVIQDSKCPNCHKEVPGQWT